MSRHRNMTVHMTANEQPTVDVCIARSTATWRVTFRDSKQSLVCKLEDNDFSYVGKETLADCDACMRIQRGHTYTRNVCSFYHVTLLLNHAFLKQAEKQESIRYFDTVSGSHLRGVCSQYLTSSLTRKGNGMLETSVQLNCLVCVFRE